MLCSGLLLSITHIRSQRTTLHLSNCRRAMSTASTRPNELSPASLKRLREFWFDGMPDELVADDPKQSACMKNWFFGGSEFDERCREGFAPAVKATESLSPEELLALAQDNHEDALSLILLLDQIPRNIFRGEEASKAYTETDPKAQELCRAFVSPPRNFDAVGNWPNFYYRLFMYMPLMHSEKKDDHELFQSKMKEALEAPKSEAERPGMEYAKSFGEKHYAVIKKFGRYPSRNAALGRESTQEELEHLKNGPGW